MRSLTSVTAVAAGIAVSSSALADNRNAIELGLRAGYSAPLGDTTGPGTNAFRVNGSTLTTTRPGASLSDAVSGRIPLWADAGARIGPNLYVGVFFQYG